MKKHRDSAKSRCLVFHSKTPIRGCRISDFTGVYVCGMFGQLEPGDVKPSSAEFTHVASHIF